jgi:hypothetical protein
MAHSTVLSKQPYYGISKQQEGNVVQLLYKSSNQEEMKHAAPDISHPPAATALLEWMREMAVRKVIPQRPF